MGGGLQSVRHEWDTGRPSAQHRLGHNRVNMCNEHRAELPAEFRLNNMRGLKTPQRQRRQVVSKQTGGGRRAPGR